MYVSLYMSPYKKRSEFEYKTSEMFIVFYVWKWNQAQIQDENVWIALHVNDHFSLYSCYW